MITELVAISAILIGSAFSLIGVIGMLRLPDVYSKLHAAGKVSVFGAALLAIAVIALVPNAFGKGLLLIVLLIIAGPVVSHAIASAAYRLGVPLQRAMRDDLRPIMQRDQ